MSPNSKEGLNIFTLYLRNIIRHGLFLLLQSQVTHRFATIVQLIFSDWLPLANISREITSLLSSSSRYNLRQFPHVLLLNTPTLAIFIMSLCKNWQSHVRNRIRVTPEVNSEAASRTAQPRARPPSQKSPQRISMSVGLQTILRRITTTYNVNTCLLSSTVLINLLVQRKATLASTILRVFPLASCKGDSHDYSALRHG